MKDIFLVNYSVKGIKTLDQFVRLSFYKKMISNQIQTQEYNIKGIYGMNGSGILPTPCSASRNLQPSQPDPDNTFQKSLYIIRILL